MKINYKALPVLNEVRGNVHKIYIENTSVYEKACVPICKVVNYDAFPGTILGKGCCGFLGYLPMIASGVVTTGLVLAATSIAYDNLGDDGNPNLTVAIGVGSSVLLGVIASAFACYRTSMCYCGPNNIKYKVETKSGEPIKNNV